MRQRDQIFQKKCKKTKARDKMIDIYDKENFTFLAIIYEPLYMSHLYGYALCKES